MMRATMALAPRSGLLCGILLVSFALRVIAGQTGSRAGDPTRGEAILAGKGGCLACHRVADRGSHLGPDLSAIGNERTVPALEQAILVPPSIVQPRYRLYRVLTRQGRTYTGRLLNQDPYSLQMLDATDRLIVFSKTDLREFDFSATPPMPSYRDKLNQAEQADLIAYLTSLKGVVRE